MIFKDFCLNLERIEEVSSRNMKIDLCVELLLRIDTSDLQETIYFLNSRINPIFSKEELNIGKGILINVLARYSKDKRRIADKLKRSGDIGDFASIFIPKEKDKILSLSLFSEKDDQLDLHDVFDILEKCTKMVGKGSSKLKEDLLYSATLRMSDVELKYFFRCLSGNIRCGISERSLVEVIGRAEHSENIEKNFYATSDLGRVAVNARKNPDSILDISLGYPIFPKLVERGKSIDDIFSRIQEPLVQPKFDGLRLNIHVLSKKNEVKIFTRGLEDMTESFPEIVEALKGIGRDMILDGEGIGIDNNGKMFSFQDTIKRKRKYNVKQESKNIPFKFFIFDILYLDGNSLLNEPLYIRLDLLKSLKLDCYSQVIKYTDNMSFTDVKEANSFFLEQINKGMEGIVAKDKLSKYTPGIRNFDWIKLKKSSHVTDTIDAVCLGYYRGSGSRSNGVGAILVGLMGDDENYYTIAKIGSGLTDSLVKSLKKRIDDISVEGYDKYIIPKELAPDVYCLPQIVVEVKADDISYSSIHSSGKALRFPRLIRIRDDKKVSDQTGLTEFINMKI